MNGLKNVFKKILTIIYNIFLFIILLPFNLFKYLNLFIYYMMKLMIKETPEKMAQRQAREEQKGKEIELERKRAKEYIQSAKNDELKYFNDKLYLDNKLSKKEQREEHKIAKEKIRREKIRQKEVSRKEKKVFMREFRQRNPFAMNKQKKLDRKRQILTLDVSSEDAKRSTEKMIFKYIAKNPEGKIEKGKFQGYSKLDVHSYLLSEGYEVYEIKLVAKANLFNTDIGLNRPMKKSLLVFYLTQLSTYLKAGIPIVESIKILTNQAKSDVEKTIWKSVVYELTMGSTLSDAMGRCGNNIFPKLLINMIKTAEITGDLPEVLDEQAEYYRSNEKSRKEMINALMYPIFVLILSIAIIIYIMIYVIPKFVTIYDNLDAELPGVTKILISMSNFIQNYIFIILIVVILIILIFTLLYKKNTIFKSNIQYIIMHMPIIKNIIIYNEMMMFAKTFATLINNNIFITDSMDILSRITDNEIYKNIIYDAVASLSKGENISVAFNDHWAFPDIAYQMIVTGEKTGELGTMMDKVAEYYQEEHNNAISRIKALIEPLMIIFLAIIVGGILLAVIIPMFSMYGNLI